MSAINPRALVKCSSDGRSYLTSDAQHMAAFWDNAELSGADVSVRAWRDDENKGTLRISNTPQFSVCLNLTPAELQTLAEALLLCAADLKDRAHMPIQEAA